MIPNNWQDFLNSKVFVINLDRKPNRLNKSIERINNAGFKNIEKFKAIDGLSDDMELIWKSFNNPKFNNDDTQFIDKIHHSHHQAICLSHLSIYKKIIENNIDFSVIFEDDIVFHKHWNSLGPLYYENTPKDFDMCYIGHHCGCGFNSIIALNFPVYCLHAYCITLNGAKILYNKILNDINGVYTIDCMLYKYMLNNDNFLKWYVWNGEHFPDLTAKKHEIYKHKDMGLVFQEYDGNKYDDYK